MPNKTIYKSYQISISRSSSCMDAVFKLVVHEESEICTSLIHSFTKASLLQLPQVSTVCVPAELLSNDSRFS